MARRKCRCAGNGWSEQPDGYSCKFNVQGGSEELLLMINKDEPKDGDK
jgi:hypothetical protein